MKKIFLLGLVGLLTSCMSESEMEKRRQVENETEGVFNKVTEFHYKNHSYLYFTNTGSSKVQGFVHDPDCACHKHDSSETDFGF